MFGYTVEEMVGNNVSMLMPEPHRSQHNGYLQQYLETGKAYVLGVGRELLGRRRDHSTFAIELSVSEMSIGDEKKFTGLIKDISDRKNAEKDLMKESKALTRLNEVAAGYTENEHMNMTPCDIKPEIQEADFRDMIDPLISGKQPSLSFETVHQHKNGARIPVEIFLQYINPPGESPRFVAIVRDVSERHEATRRLNATIDEMTYRTKEITSLSELADLLYSCHNVSEAYEVVTRFMPMLLPELSGSLYIIDEAGTSMKSVGSWGRQPPEETVFLPEDCVAVRRGLAYTAITDESALFCRHLPQRKPEVSYCLPLAAQGETFGIITVSIGISVYPELGETSGELMKKADQALYQAKETGRDRVVLAEPSKGMSGFSSLKLRR